MRPAPAAALLAAALVAAPAGAEAYRHHTSRIHYREWGDAAFAEARRDGKPVFLLISATWCYWCKYFDEHTLETDEVAGYLNRHFVSVFVDSDLRGDLARRWARGWPMTVLFDPDGRVRLTFPGALRQADFLDVLRRVVADVAARAPAPAAPAAAPPSAPVPVTAASRRQLDRAWLAAFDALADPQHGGLGRGRKFPYPRVLDWLVEHGRALRERARRAAVERTLDALLGSLFDPIEGGFFRYAERPDWREPHTEKLLAVNAGLALVYHRAARVLGHARYAQASGRTVEFLLRRLYDHLQGGFHGSQSADPAWYRLAPEARRRAPRPPVNPDKITAWNAEAALAFLVLARDTGRADVRQAAVQTVEFLYRRLWREQEGGMFHAWRTSAVAGVLPGQLEPAVWAALVFFEAQRFTGRLAYREAGERVLDWALAALFDGSRGLFAASIGGEGPDGRTPDHPLDLNGLAAEALLVSGLPAHRAAAARVLGAAGGALAARLSDGEATPRALADGVSVLRAWRRAAPP